MELYQVTSTMERLTLANEVSLKSLPKILQPYYNIDLVRSSEMTQDEKISLVKMYGKTNMKEWVAPRTGKAKEFALDMILH